MVNVRVCIKGKMKVVNIIGKASVENLLERLCINPETVVVLKNNEVVPDFEIVSCKDKIEIVDIVSRG
jgi:sulfur carrier protein ThiS